MDFENKREKFNQTQEVPLSTGTRRMSTITNQGEIILEKKFQISKEEQNYYRNPKVYSNLTKHVGGHKSSSPKDNAI
jgi:hypothetical protein